jgi:hypothetical protein
MSEVDAAAINAWKHVRSTASCPLPRHDTMYNYLDYHSVAMQRPSGAHNTFSLFYICSLMIPQDVHALLSDPMHATRGGRVPRLPLLATV